MPEIKPHGEEGVPTPMTPTNTPPPNLPGQTITSLPTPALPNTTPDANPGVVPHEWQDPVRIIRVILDLYEADPFEAAEVAKQAQAWLDAINKRA